MLTPPEEILEEAIASANNSICRSKRGAVIFRLRKDQVDVLASSGWNHQPTFLCDGSETCKSTCGKTAVHAEQSAILRMGPWRWSPHFEILHVKTVDGLLVPSGPPSCLECSKLILEAGIEHVWLFHEDGWKRYGAGEFHQLTMEHHQIGKLESADWPGVVREIEKREASE